MHLTVLFDYRTKIRHTIQKRPLLSRLLAEYLHHTVEISELTVPLPLHPDR
jgi:predicted amidophosphoribosyltransferase